MKTIAISIDEPVLERVDRLARGSATRRNRSHLIREAVREYVSRIEHQAEEARETSIVRQHRERLGRQARALVAEQAKP